MSRRLTLPQRLARPIINSLVERLFPNSLYFYGNGPLAVFDKMDGEKRSPTGSTAALYLARRAHEEGASELSVELTGMTINGEDIGDWRITVERKALSQ